MDSTRKAAAELPASRSENPQANKESTLGTIDSTEAANNYITGGRLHLITIALCMTIWLANFEIGIVSTSLVAISNDLHGFERSSWIITSYLLTFTGFFIVWAKFSDIVGRKPSVIVVVLIFTIFSGVCGAAQSVTQLSILRAFQGIGASGCYTLTVVIIFELVPPVKYPTYLTLISMVFAFSLMIGPLVGGAITNSISWRWIFLINVPAGVIIIALLSLSIPKNFPYHGEADHQKKNIREFLALPSVRHADVVGALSLLTASIFFVSALQLAETQFAWSSAVIISFLVVSFVFWTFFFGWEWFRRTEQQMTNAVFPHAFFRNRVWLIVLVNSLFVGVPFTVAVIQIPLRLQVVYGLSPLAAAVRFLPFAFCSPFGSALGSMSVAKGRIPPVYILLIGATFQVVGFALLSTLPTSGSVWPAQYAFEVIAGLGTGVNTGVLFLLTPVVIEQRYHSVAIGAIVQFRMLGGAIGLAITTSILNGYIRHRLSAELSPNQLKALLETVQTIRTFEPSLQMRTRLLFGEAYNRQLYAVIGVCAAQLLALLGLWKREQLKVH